MPILVWLLTVFSFLCCNSLASAMPLNAEHFETNNILFAVNLENHTRFAPDPSNSLTPFSPELEKSFLKGQHHSASIGYSNHPWWAEVTLENSFNSKQLRYLEFADSGEGMPEITFFVKNQRGEVKSIISGGAHRPTPELLEHRFLVLPLQFMPREKLTVQVRAQGDAINIPLHLHTQQNLLESDYLETTWAGISYGVIILLVLYNLTIFVAARDKNHLYYVVYLFFMGLALTGFDGISARYFLRHFPYLNMHLINISACAACASLMLFTHEFLRIKPHMPKLSRLIMALIFASGALAIANFGIKLNAATNALVSAGALLSFISALLVQKKEPKLTKIYLLPILFFVVGSALTNARLAGFLSPSFFTNNGLRIGILANAILWSMALSHRISILTKEKFKAETQLLSKIQQTENEQALALEEQMALVEKISNKFDAPLQSLLADISALRNHGADLAQKVFPEEAHNSTLAAFLREWRRQQFVISTSIDRLRSLSASLTEFRQHHRSLKAAKEGAST